MREQAFKRCSRLQDIAITRTGPTAAPEQNTMTNEYRCYQQLGILHREFLARSEPIINEIVRIHATRPTPIMPPCALEPSPVSQVIAAARVAMDLRNNGDPANKLGRAYDDLTAALGQLSRVPE